MVFKPETILKLESQLNIELPEFKERHSFLFEKHTLGYARDQNGRVTSLNIGNGLFNSLDIQFLQDFPFLLSLSINGISISDLSPISCLEKLEMLDLNNTGLDNLLGLSTLTELKHLNLSLNKIKNITAIGRLSQLSYLDVSKNQIAHIEPLRDCKNLRSLIISNNHIRDLSPILSLPQLSHVVLYGNPNINIDYPPEVVRGGWTSIKVYSEQSKALVVYKNVKVLLLGNPTVGKSSLLNYLEKGGFSDSESTHGVVYKEVVFNDITYHFWDFGGQEYFHATHKLFFSPNALNIILWSADKIEGQESCLSIDYWIRTVQQLNAGVQSEVLLIENKIDLNNPKYRPSELNQSILAGKYKNIRLYYQAVSLLDNKGIESLLETLSHLADGLIKQFTYPGFFNVFKQRIDATGKSVVSIDEINSRPGKDNVKQALKLFHNMGFMLYFPEILPERVFCKPQDLLELIYKKVLCDIKKYKLSLIEIEYSIQANNLQMNAHELILLMKHFDLVFEIKNESDIFFIPQYLPSTNHWILKFQVQTFLPSTVHINADNFLMNLAMQRIFSSYGTFVSKEHDDYLFWRDGIIIEKKSALLMIKFIRESQRIELYNGRVNRDITLEKEIVDFILDLPEDPDAPKRNFENHIKQRIRQTSDENDDLFSPNGLEYLSEASESEFESSMLIGYLKERNWSSDYFELHLSLDGQYFISWQELTKNRDLSEVRTYSNSGESRLEKASQFSNYINPQFIKKTNENDRNVTEISPPTASIQYNFHGTVNAAAIGNSNVVQSPGFRNKTKPESAKPNEFAQSVNEKASEKRAIRKWKAHAVMILALYVIVAITYSICYNYELVFLANKGMWKAYKAGGIHSILCSLYTALGVALVYKLGYDRLFDPSKEKAFLDLYRLNKK